MYETEKPVKKMVKGCFYMPSEYSPTYVEPEYERRQGDKGNERIISIPVKRIEKEKKKTI